MKRFLILSTLVATGALTVAPVGWSHQVTPPGLDGECTTTLHAGKAVPAHTIAMPTAAANSPAVTGGFCTG
jgi:hypothetical protein